MGARATWLEQPSSKPDARPAAWRQRARASVEQRLPIARYAAVRLHFARGRRHVELDALRHAPATQHRRGGAYVGGAAVDARDDVGLVDLDAACLHLCERAHRLHVVGPRDMRGDGAQVEFKLHTIRRIVVLVWREVL